MSEPIRVALSQDEAIARARSWMVETYGPVSSDGNDPDRWHERFGQLLSFIMDTFPVATPPAPPQSEHKERG